MGLCCCKQEIIDLNSEVELLHFQLLRSVGRGAFGKVQIVQHRKSKKLYALKYINKEKCITMNAVENILQERNILEAVKHPFLCNLCFSFQDEENLFMVLELELGGDLRFHLDRRGPFSEEEVRFLVAELCLALDYLHETCRIIHRDIKPDNVLLDERGFAHLTDFNIAVRLHRNRPRTSIAGSLAYMAPEIFLREGYDGSVDWWSLGVLAYELLTGRRPFHGKSNEQLTQSILEDPITWPSSMPESQLSGPCRDFVIGLLCRNPKQRLGTGSAGGLAAIKSHPWFSSLSFTALLEKKLAPPFCPDSRKINFDAAHELEEVLMEENPLRVRPRKRQHAGSTGSESASVFSTPEIAKTALVFTSKFRTYDFTKPLLPESLGTAPSGAHLSQQRYSSTTSTTNFAEAHKSSESPAGSMVGANSANYRGSIIKLPPPRPSDKPVTDVQLRTIGSNEDSPQVDSILHLTNDSLLNIASKGSHSSNSLHSIAGGQFKDDIPSASVPNPAATELTSPNANSMVTPQSQSSFSSPLET